MKRSIIAIVAFSLIAPGMALAQSPHRGGPDNGRRVESRHDPRPYTRNHHVAKPQKHQQQQHAWRRGERLPPQYRKQHVDYRRYGLRPPPRGQQWVRVDNNYALISAATGLIMALSQIR
ncbi:RcnB family protein [Pseudochelatococcus sp. B33]